VIQQPARGRDQDVDAAAQLRDLRIDLDAAEDHRRGQRQVLAVGLTLSCTWAASSRVGVSTSARTGRRPRRLVPARRSCLHEPLQQRQREAGGLAGAGLGAGHDIEAFRMTGMA
jgi:hypothetical protein